MRAEKHKRAADAAREGVLSSLLEGGGSLVSGLASGVTGLFSRPIEGALKSGPSGFVRGIGIGVVGAAVGPVLGVTDGLNSVAQTLLIQSAEGTLRSQIRPVRTLDCATEGFEWSPTYPLIGGLLVLTPIDPLAVRAQAAVQLRAKKNGENDAFVGFCSLEKKSTRTSIYDNKINSIISPSSFNTILSLSKTKIPAVILSTRYLFLLALTEVVPQGPSPLLSEMKKKENSSKSIFSWNKKTLSDGYEIIPWNCISHFYQFDSYCAHTHPTTTPLTSEKTPKSEKRGRLHKYSEESEKDKAEKRNGENEENEENEDSLKSLKYDDDDNSNDSNNDNNNDSNNNNNNRNDDNRNNNNHSNSYDNDNDNDNMDDINNELITSLKNAAEEQSEDKNRNASRNQNENENESEIGKETTTKLSKFEEYDKIRITKILKGVDTPGLWGIIVVLSNKREITVHCPSHRIALSLSILLEKNNKRVRRPYQSHFMSLS